MRSRPRFSVPTRIASSTKVLVACGAVLIAVALLIAASANFAMWSVPPYAANPPATQVADARLIEFATALDSEDREQLEELAGSGIAPDRIDEMLDDLGGGDLVPDGACISEFSAIYTCWLVDGDVSANVTMEWNGSELSVIASKS